MSIVFFLTLAAALSFAAVILTRQYLIWREAEREGAVREERRRARILADMPPIERRRM